jgi:hypothetical protein
VLFILLFFIVIVVIIIVTTTISANRRKQAEAASRMYLQQCWNQYQWALQNIQRDPSARANVVNFGRAYYGALRGTVTLYDEMAISNDIKAAGG